MDNTLIFPLCILIVLFFLYTYFTFGLVDTILEGPRFKKWRIIPIGIINVGICCLLTLLPASSSVIFYLTWGLLLFVEFAIFYKDKLDSILFCAASCILHIMTIRSIVVAFFAIIANESVYFIANDSAMLFHSTSVSIVFICLAIAIIMKFIPTIQLKIIKQHNIHLWFMIAWMTVFNVYLLYNSRIYSIAKDHPSLIANQMLAPLAILIGLYVVLFFSMKTGVLLGFKEKNEQLQLAINSEQQYRESMIKDSIMTYELNLTQGIVEKGFEKYELRCGVGARNYNEMLQQLSSEIIHPDDLAGYLKVAEVPNLLSEFESGRGEIIAEYRRRSLTGDYIWVRSTTNIVRDSTNNDVKAFTYIKDINDEKQRQLELQSKAERDSLTGLYNRGTMGVKIAEAISISDVKSGALFVIDVDNFKSVNDSLGHVYGDAVLCELSEKLKRAFVNDGFVGRIGGDEFMAFMKQPSSIEDVKQRADRLCKDFASVYKAETNANIIVSGSIGVSLFPQDGKSFDELYKNSDAALYAAKNSGKNSFCLYDGKAFSGYESSRTEIDNKGTSSQKSFKENRIEYVFKILYASDNPIVAIHAVLELVTSHFSFDRGYIFETSADGKTTSTTFEWCREGVSAQLEAVQDVPIEAVATANASFLKTGMFILNSLDELEPVERAVLEPQGIKAMFQFGIFDHEELLGFIGFDTVITPREVNEEEEIYELLTICNILATFFVKQRLTDNLVKSVTSLMSVMDNLNSFTYVVEKDSFRVLYMNEKAASFVGLNQVNPTCYQHFRGNAEPCEDCPIKGLDKNSEKTSYTCDVYNKKIDLWLESTASSLKWIDGVDVYLISCTDISKYKCDL